MGARALTGQGVVWRRFVRWALNRLYHQFAWTYDWVSWIVSMGQWRSWQRAALPYLRGRRVLEVAHGTGDLLLDLVGLGFSPVGLDASPAMSRIAGGKLRRALGGPGLRVPLLRAQVEALPFAAGSFQALAATFPTEYVADPAAIAEFYRVLTPGGALVCVPAAQITGGTWGDRWAAWLFRVTGQSASDWCTPLVGRYAAAGFRARAEAVRQARSIVTVIIAEKAAAGQNAGLGA
ncbi:MAG: class I SAM-dependent methyltransferase [Anaerolineales bacterium]|nr:class I SAM-dependent methyltransferase [Anaerolineales bacterium]